MATMNPPNKITRIEFTYGDIVLYTEQSVQESLFWPSDADIISMEYKNCVFKIKWWGEGSKYDFERELSNDCKIVTDGIIIILEEF